MIVYILKTIACSAILLVAYKWLLEGAKMNQVKRFYLLGAALLSFIIPFIEFTVSPRPSSEPIVVHYENGVFSTPTANPINKLEESLHINWLLVVYGIVTLFLVFKYGRNVVKMFRATKQPSTLQFEKIPLLFSHNAITPYSFWNRIFISEASYLDKNIDERVLYHEAAHVKQKHTLDILVLELLRSIAWFNPVLYVYKKAIQLNHEFLADDAVLKKHPQTASYMQLVLSHQYAGELQFTSSFNYLTTKKRFSMFTRKTPVWEAAFKIIIVTLMIGGCIYIFPKRSFAQEKSPSTIVVKDVIGVAPGREASEELMKEAKELITPFRRYGDEHALIQKTKIPDSVKNRLYFIFCLMNEEQKETAPFYFKKPLPPFQKSVPSQQQLSAWKNPRLFGVWIDGKKTDNSLLSNYSNTDFSHAYVSRLHGKAKENKPYNYQVDLMTNNYYQDYYKKALADTSGNILVVRAMQRASQ